MKSAYDILGIDQNASEEEVKNAYRRYSKVLHPDVNKRPTATQEFKELKSAYETLIDPAMRSKHDYAIAVVETKDVERDVIDSVIDNFSMQPKKKKKKKKKKQKMDQAMQQGQAYMPPPYVPPQIPQSHYNGRGQGQFEGIPDGYDNYDDLGGVL